MISTRDLSALPDIPTLRRRMQALAVLDAVVSPEWEYRYYSFNAAWGDGEQLGSMRDGTGNHLFVWFGPAGCWVKGFDHESGMSPFRQSPPAVMAGVLDAVPAAFADCLREPAFNLDETTFCVWRTAEDTAWHRGPVVLPPGEEDVDADGSAGLLSPLDGRAETYATWAAEYYETDLPLAAIAAVFAGTPLTDDCVVALGGRSVRALRDDLAEIGYPAEE